MVGVELLQSSLSLVFRRLILTIGAHTYVRKLVQGRHKGIVVCI